MRVLLLDCITKYIGYTSDDLLKFEWIVYGLF